MPAALPNRAKAMRGAMVGGLQRNPAANLCGDEGGAQELCQHLTQAEGVRVDVDHLPGCLTAQGDRA